jgi:uncharacterized protein (DUF169 family)
LIKDESEIPQKALRPVKNYKTRLLICQCLHLTKTTGRTHALLTEDNYCLEGSCAHGWAEKPPYMQDGTAIYPRLVPDLEIAKKFEQDKPAVSTNKGYIGCVMSPLGWTKVEPDLILLSLNAARMNRVIEGICDQTAEKIVAENSGRGGLCCWGIAPTINSGKPTYVIPTFGEYRFTGDSDDDMWFILPVSYLEPLVKGFEHMYKAGWRYPIPRFVEHEPRWPDGMYGWETYEAYNEKKAKGENYEEFKDNWMGTYTDKDWFEK